MTRNKALWIVVNTMSCGVRANLRTIRPGVVNAAEGRPISLQTFTITDGKITAIDLLDDPGRIAVTDLALLDR